MIRSTWLVAGLLFFVPPGIYSQEDCSAKIQEAKKFYEMGMIEEIHQMLSPCIEYGFTRTQKIEAYKLIILSYLFDDDQFEAERSMLEFLKKFPEYEIIPNDPVEFVYLFDSYRTSSVFSFGLMGGFNLTDPKIIEPYTLFNLNETTLKNTMKPGFQVGIGAGRYVGKRMLLNLEFYFSENQYRFSNEITMPLIGGNDAINLVTFSERLFKIEVPLTLAYEFNVRTLHFFIRAGVSAANLTGITGIPSRKYAQELPPFTGESIDMSDYRNDMLYSGVIGAGLRYKVPRGVITFDLRTNIGLNNIVKSEKRYDNQELAAKFYYIDNDFSPNTLSLSAGYYFSFYKPKKQQ
ncbi:MAG TPA: outer membrane beta-barrel protein [Bacteroidales bacterium]|nr:outer membrane beta-barrel protein [Bacteroidales bacterium]